MTARIRGPVVGFVLFGIYAATAGRGVGWEDSAFFQLALATLGVPHGPGFPLYVLLGHIWVLPFGTAAAWGANLLSAAAMAACGVVLLEILILLFIQFDDARTGALRPWALVAGLSVVFAWGTSPAIWNQAVRTEVYPLTLLLVLLTVYLALRTQAQWEHDRASAQRTALAAIWVWGLGMAVHPLVCLAAATPWLLWPLWRWRRRMRMLLMAVLIGLLPLTLYAFPLLRGRLDGVWSWGSFSDLASVFDYYLRRSAWAAVPAGQNHYLENISGWFYTALQSWPEILWIPLAVSLIWLRRRWSYWLSLLSVVALVVWAAPFDRLNLDLWGYFLPFVAFAAVGIGLFVMRAADFIYRQTHGMSAHSRQAIGIFAAALVVGWPVISVIAGHRVPSAGAGARDFVNAVSASLPHGATVVAAEDNVLGVLEYARRVERIRPDLTVIAPGALRYPFYRRQLAGVLPDTLAARWSSADIWTQRYWESNTAAWLEQMSKLPNVYTQFDRIPGLQLNHLKPAGFFYALSDTTQSTDWNAARDFWLLKAADVAHDPVSRDIIARWQFNFGAFAMARGQEEVGWAALVASIEENDQNPELYYRLGDALRRAGRNQEATAMFAAACELAPYRSRYQQALNLTTKPLALEE